MTDERGLESGKSKVENLTSALWLLGLRLEKMRDPTVPIRPTFRSRLYRAFNQVVWYVVLSPLCPLPTPLLSRCPSLAAGVAL